MTPLRVAGASDTGALIRVTDMEIQLAQLNSTFVIYALVAVGATALVTVVTGLPRRQVAGAPDLVRRTAESITEEDMSRRIEVRGKDDLAALTRTINGMLDRLESLVTTQRNLLDDVGHELKTPLTVLHGHLELLDPEDPEEVARTRDLALDEVERMGHLTEELLVLAQSQRRLRDQASGGCGATHRRGAGADPRAGCPPLADGQPRRGACTPRPRTDDPGLAAARPQRGEILSRR